MSPTELTPTEQHHKLYDSSSPIVEVPAEDILGGADPTRHGLVLQRPGESVPYASVRPPFYRTSINDNHVRADDIVPFTAERIARQDLDVPAATSLTVGGEIELSTWRSQPGRKMGYSSRWNWTAEELERQLRAEGMKTSAEVWNKMLEINEQPSASTDTRLDNLQATARAMARAQANTLDGIQLLPISSQPYFVETTDVQEHPYVQRIVLEGLGLEAVKQLGASYQVHIQMLDIDSGLYTVNALRKVMELFTVLTQNGPCVEGRMTKLLSTRGQARRVMPTGSTLSQLPDWDESLKFGVGMLMIGEVPSLCRALSNHHDIRPRFDIPPHGTIEFAAVDNPGGHIDKLIMMQELFRLSTWRTYQAYQRQESLPAELFGGNNDNILDINKSAVEKNGSRATLLSGTYQPTTVDSQLAGLFDWIKTDRSFTDNAAYPFKKLEDEVSKSLRWPDFTNLPSTSMARFYESGDGVPAYYFMARYNKLVAEDDISETMALNLCLADYAQSYQNYLERF